MSDPLPAVDDLLGLIPDLERIPGFKSQRCNQRRSPLNGTLHATVFGERAADGLSVRIWVMWTPTPAKAEAEALHWTRAAAGDMPPGSPSGVIYGERSWYSRYEPGHAPGRSLTLLALLGRSLTRVDLTKRQEAGTAPPLSAADLELAETLVGQIVDRLKEWVEL